MICPLSKRIIETIHSQRQSFHLQGNENGFFGGASLIVQLVKNLPAMQETWIQFLDSIPGRSPGERNPLQYSCLGNPMERGAWQATVHRVTRVGHSD